MGTGPRGLTFREKRQRIGDQSLGPSSQAGAPQERLVSRLTAIVSTLRRRWAMRLHAAPTAPSVTCIPRHSRALPSYACLQRLDLLKHADQGGWLQIRRPNSHRCSAELLLDARSQPALLGFRAWPMLLQNDGQPSLPRSKGERQPPADSGPHFRPSRRGG